MWKYVYLYEYFKEKEENYDIVEQKEVEEEKKWIEVELPEALSF